MLRPCSATMSLLCFHRRLHLRFTVPFERPRQSLLERYPRRIAKKFPRLRNIGLGIANVSLARRFVFRFERLAGDFSKLAQNFVEGNAPSHADIENFSRNIGSFAREKIRLDRVLDV